MEDFRDFLEYLLDAPAVQIVREQIPGRIASGVQEVGDQRDVRLAGPLQRDLPDVAAFGMIGGSQPAPFLEECSALGVDSRLYRALRIPVETDLGMATDQKMIPAVGILLHALQGTKAAVRQEQESPRDLGTNEGKPLRTKAHVVGIPILVRSH